MSILTTYPGKFGDLLWALPSIRALSRRVGEPIDLLVSHDMESIVPLLRQQPYLREVSIDQQWIRTDVDPNQKRLPPSPLPPADLTLHLGYRDWPKRPLPYETLDTLNAQSEILGSRWTRFGTIHDSELSLDEPWISASRGPHQQQSVAVGFSDDHFELKVGLCTLLDYRESPTDYDDDDAPPRDSGMYALWPSAREGSRWQREFGCRACAWEEAAKVIHTADLFLGDNSALHVLAVAVGTPVVLMEPSEARWNPIFYPLGTTGPQVTLVLGNDGRPTFDARHTRDTLLARLASPKESVR